MRRALIVLTLALTAGCSGTSHHAGSSATRSPSAAPSPTTLSVPEAADAYLRLVAPCNTAITAFNAATVTSTPNLSRVRATASATVTTCHRMLAGLLATSWPAVVAEDVRKLAAASAKEQGVDEPFETVRTMDQYQAAVAAFNSADLTAGGTYAELIRTKLGLPPAS